jgi:Flp pilus assembly protein TadG
MQNDDANRRQGPQRRGAATVELAVVAPLFLLLLSGIIEFGFAFRAQHALSNAARRGARAAAVEGSSTSTVVADVKNHCVRILGVNEGAVAVSVKVNSYEGAELHDAVSGDEITITVSIPFSAAGTGFFANILTSSTLSSTSTFERE